MLIVCGFNQDDYWNDCVQKYEHKKNKRNVCPENIVVLYGDGTPKDAAKIPAGTQAGGAFTSGGVFEATRANVDKAFAYIKKRMNDENCADPEFQFHTTGHGGGYNSVTQDPDPQHLGYEGGRLDANGDEATKINENDFRLQAGNYTIDLDGDGDGDIQVQMVNNPNAPPAKIARAFHDADDNGTYETLIGTDTDEDGLIEKDDADWNAPDLDGSGTTNDVGFDETVILRGADVLTDDELKTLIQTLQNDTNLKKEKTRAELAQCFSGGFAADLDGVTTAVTGASEEGQYSHSVRGANGYNVYEKAFIEALDQGKNWAQADIAGFIAAILAGFDQDSVIRNSGFSVPVFGTNPPILQNLSTFVGAPADWPVLGFDWMVQLDCTIATTPSLAIFRLSEGPPILPLPSPWGDILVDPTAGSGFNFFQPHGQDAQFLVLPIPPDPMLMGVEFSVQGLCGSSPKGVLSNALYERIGNQ